jgi:nitrate/nitrite-specific signal transduction histidine kinase
MRERVRAVRGELTFKAHPGHGTEITVQVPLKNRNANARASFVG